LAPGRSPPPGRQDHAPLLARIFPFQRRGEQQDREVRVSSTVLTFSVLISIQERDRSARHDCRDGVLVDELGMAVTPQKHTKIVEPGDDPLQLHTIDEENCERRLVFANVIKEGVL